MVLPPMQEGDIQPLADGATLTGEGSPRVIDRGRRPRYLLAAFAPGADRAAVIRHANATPEFKAIAGEGDCVADQGVSGPTRPPEVERLRSIDFVPQVLARARRLPGPVIRRRACPGDDHTPRHAGSVLKTLASSVARCVPCSAWQATALRSSAWSSGSDRPGAEQPAVEPRCVEPRHHPRPGLPDSRPGALHPRHDRRGDRHRAVPARRPPRSGLRRAEGRIAVAQGVGADALPHRRP